MSYLGIILSVFVVYIVFHDLRNFREKIDFSIQIWKMTNIRIVIGAVLTLTLTIGTIVLLSYLFPFMNKISWVYLFSGESYNIFVSSPRHIGIDENNILYKLGYSTFLIALFLLLPHWALIEEKIFRQGKNNWKKVPKHALFFGLIHMVAGVPLTAGLALAVPGLAYHAYYLYSYEKYLKDSHMDDSLVGIEIEANSMAEAIGTLQATALHTVYNSIAITILFLTTIFWI